MPYFPVDDQAAFHPKFLAAGNASIGLWTRAGSWCKANASGGRVPREVAALLGTQREARKLVDVGLWEVDGTGYVFHDWDHQAGNFGGDQEKTRREKDRDRKRRQRERERVLAEEALAARDAERDLSRDVTRDSERTSERSHSGVTPPPSPSPSHPSSPDGEDESLDRSDVAELCQLLADLVEENGSKRPAVTKAWRDSARLLLDRDGRELDAAKRLVRWTQGDSFWRSNVLSMPTFRKQYDRLRLAANHQLEERRRAEQPRVTAAQRNLSVVERFAALEQQEQYPSALEGM